MKVLVVDDDPTVRKLLERFLGPLGHSVVVAQDGNEAVETLCDASTPFDAVILDLVMPSMDGWATFRAMRAYRRRLPVVIISGFDALGVAGLLTDSRVTFLQKPFLRDQLVAALELVTAASSQSGSGDK